MIRAGPNRDRGALKVIVNQRVAFYRTLTVRSIRRPGEACTTAAAPVFAANVADVQRLHWSTCDHFQITPLTIKAWRGERARLLTRRSASLA